MTKRCPGQGREAAAMAFYRAHGPFQRTGSLPSFLTEECFITATVMHEYSTREVEGTSVWRGRGRDTAAGTWLARGGPWHEPAGGVNPGSALLRKRARCCSSVLGGLYFISQRQNNL